MPPPTLCVNGSPAHGLPPPDPDPDPGSGRPPASSGLGPFHKPLPMSRSLLNLSPRAFTEPCGGPAADGRRWSFDKPGEEEKAAIVAALEQSGPMLGGDELDQRLGRPDPSVASRAESQGGKQKKNGRGGSAGKGQSQRAESEGSTAVPEEKHKGWFGCKDLHSKPR